MIGRRSAAIRPANPLPTGICTPRSTSSSIPFAARARNVMPVSSSNRIAAVSDPRISVTRSSSSRSNSSSDRYASAASATRCSDRRRRLAASASTRARRSCS